MKHNEGDYLMNDPLIRASAYGTAAGLLIGIAYAVWQFVELMISAWR